MSFQQPEIVAQNPNQVRQKELVLSVVPVPGHLCNLESAFVDSPIHPPATGRPYTDLHGVL